MSDKKKDDPSRESKNNDKNNKNNTNKSDDPQELTEAESFHSARENLVIDEGKTDEPRSSNYLSTSGKIHESNSENDHKDTEPQIFRSSMSMHHLQTIKSDGETAPPASNKKILAQSSVDTMNVASPDHSPAHRISQPISANEQPKTVRYSGLIQDGFEENAKRGSSMESAKRHSRPGSLKNGDSFLTNLNVGTAFVYMVLPPDGGYGWVITFVSFLVQIITDGIVFSVGIVLPAMAKDFKVEMAEAILISALQICFYYLSGPITSAIINKFGFRVVAIIGASGGALCLLAASFVANFEMMLLFYSVLAGPCLAMIWVASQLIIGYYFEKYRSIANGLSCAGSGAGYIIFVQLNTYLLPEIGWRNNTRIHAGFLIVALLLSFTFSEVPPSKIGIIREQDPSNEFSDEDNERELGSFKYADPVTVEPEDRAVEFLTLEKIPTKDFIAYQRRDSYRLQKCFHKCVCCNCCRRVQEEEEDTNTKRFVIKKELIERQDLYYTGPAEYTEHDRAAKREIIDGQDVELIEVERPVKSINYSMSQSTARKSKTEEEAIDTQTKGRFYRLNPAHWIPKPMKRTFQILFNFSLFRIMEFQVLFASAFLFAQGYNIPFLYSKARLKLPESDMSFIPLFIGVTNFMFRIVCGFIAFKFKTSVIYLCGGTIVLGGVACTVSGFYGSDNFWFQIVYACVFGMAPAFFSTLRAIIYVQYLGLETLTNAFCLISMGMGFAIFFGTMIGGFLNKETGGYMAPFIFSGINIAASGILKLLLPYLSSRRQTERKVKFQV